MGLGDAEVVAQNGQAGEEVIDIDGACPAVLVRGQKGADVKFGDVDAGDGHVVVMFIAYPGRTGLLGVDAKRGVEQEVLIHA